MEPTTRSQPCPTLAELDQACPKFAAVATLWLETNLGLDVERDDFVGEELSMLIACRAEFFDSLSRHAGRLFADQIKRGAKRAKASQIKVSKITLRQAGDTLLAFCKYSH